MRCEVEFSSLFVSMEGRIENGIKIRTRCYGRHYELGEVWMRFVQRKLYEGRGFRAMLITAR